jgi:hypothetical protein
MIFVFHLSTHVYEFFFEQLDNLVWFHAMQEGKAIDLTLYI